MRIVTALVDYDNACLVVQPERRAADVDMNLHEILNALSVRTTALVPDARDLIVRFYGGWYDRTGRITPRGAWLVDRLPAFRTRMNGLRILPVLTSALIAYAEGGLIGTHRPDLGGQKMVDTMLTADALAVAARADQLLIVSDDEDFTPAAIASYIQSQRRDMVILVRRRRMPGEAPNDRLVQERLAMTITTF